MCTYFLACRTSLLAILNALWLACFSAGRSAKKKNPLGRLAYLFRTEVPREKGERECFHDLRACEAIGPALFPSPARVVRDRRDRATHKVLAFFHLNGDVCVCVCVWVGGCPTLSLSDEGKKEGKKRLGKLAMKCSPVVEKAAFLLPRPQLATSLPRSPSKVSALCNTAAKI